MESNINNYLNKNKKQLYQLGDKLFVTPELGYKEFKTKKILTDFFHKNGLKTKNLGSRTAFSVTVGKGKPHIGLIAELDAIPTLGHPFANKKDSNAAHSCGHSTQCAIMAYSLVAVSKLKNLNGTVTLFFTPAEEFTDVAFRKELIKNKEIKYIGGKINMLVDGCFDKTDMFIHLHTMSSNKYEFSVGSTLGGFIHKEITFLGKAAHAAVCPELGINALDAFTSFYSKIGILKNKYPKTDMVRIHGIITEGGQSVNSIPERIVYECYVRSTNPNTLLKLSKEVDNAAISSCSKIKAKASIKSTNGYLPLVQSDLLNKVIDKNISKLSSKILYKEKSIAAGDVGDISVFKPIIQFGYAGFKGACHSKELCIVNKENAYLKPSIIVCNSVLDLLNNKEYSNKIIKSYKPRMTKREYINYINNK